MIRVSPFNARDTSGLGGRTRGVRHRRGAGFGFGCGRRRGLRRGAGLGRGRAADTTRSAPPAIATGTRPTPIGVVVRGAVTVTSGGSSSSGAAAGGGGGAAAGAGSPRSIGPYIRSNSNRARRSSSVNFSRGPQRPRLQAGGM